MKIVKTEITYTVLHPANEPLSRNLKFVLEQTDYGNAVGQETRRETVELPDESVRDELIALGNDGEFFEDDE